MGKNSKIEWTNHTFNPWWGCVRVSHACEHCYAENWAKRVGSKVWGISAERRFFGEKHWAEPLKWNDNAARLKVRQRVFCASMGDIFEERQDLDQWRCRLWTLIERTPNLDWLLLTKRPQNIKKTVPFTCWPTNVWLGTTVESQRWADERLPYLADIPANVRFVSAEPLLGALDLDAFLSTTVNWVIAGGESGPKARPSNPEWFRDLMRQCTEKGVPFHFKQWGDWAPLPLGRSHIKVARSSRFVDGALMVRLGKKASGRSLDGAVWNELPSV